MAWLRDVGYYDAHCHLQDERIFGKADAFMGIYGELGVDRVVVNGTCEGDWLKVAELAEKYPRVKPSFGLHPWRVNDASERWKEALAALWDAYPDAAVGEIGLDRWVEGFDLEAQEEAFAWQLDQAFERELPVSIHCLRAWGRMLELLQSSRLARRGFLLHSYGGPKEMVDSFVRLGGYFSISGYFALDRKERQREALRYVPLDRLLVETDAPDMAGPDESRLYSIDGDKALNHPGNIVGVYGFVAELFGVPIGELKERVAENFDRLFGC